jgi:hypothetical protein
VLASAAMSTAPAASGPADRPAPSGPEAMRAAMAAYVRAVHEAYLTIASTLAPAERAALPLLAADRLTVAAVGATAEAMPAPVGPEVAVADELPGLAWTLRFFDPVVLPELGLVDESAGPRPGEVRAVLGVRTEVYHLVVPPGGTLTAHHAAHAGTGLANGHAAAARDYQAIRARIAPADTGRAALVGELAGAERAGLVHAAGLLAVAIAPGDLGVAATAAADPPDLAALRRALLAALSPARSAT